MEKIKINRTAVIEVMGNEQASEVWIILHGYGQLVRYFSRKFSGLDLKDKLLVFPQGLHRYYLKGSGGRVGASWMTQEERLDDIEDNHIFLDEIVKMYNPQKDKKVVVFGFSQGAATAARWGTETVNEVSAMALWGAVFPPDMNHELWQEKGIPAYVIHGTEDPYLQNKEHHDFKLLTDLKGVEVLEYKGGHDIDTETLKVLSERLDQHRTDI